VSRPASLQVPRPVTMNAAFGAPGRDFAAKNCDYLFSTFSTIEDGRGHIADIRARASRFDREVGIYTVCHVVCRDSQAEAEAYYHRYAVAEADHAASTTTWRARRNSPARTTRAPSTSIASASRRGGQLPARRHARKDRRGHGPIADEGYAGAALTFVNYTYELPFFCDRVLPLMKQAGLRVN
jgi:alkanesulfonate monooxygenase SsuD/methylene tetrahydromethanopterin reductase-like flavin-dependent oxidoreductase (luciferase family)